jgi:hypothetical protein
MTINYIKSMYKKKDAAIPKRDGTKFRKQSNKHKATASRCTSKLALFFPGHWKEVVAVDP